MRTPEKDAPKYYRRDHAADWREMAAEFYAHSPRYWVWEKQQITPPGGEMPTLIVYARWVANQNNIPNPDNGLLRAIVSEAMKHF